MIHKVVVRGDASSFLILDPPLGTNEVTRMFFLNFSCLCNFTCIIELELMFSFFLQKSAINLHSFGWTGGGHDKWEAHLLAIGTGVLCIDQCQQDTRPIKSNLHRPKNPKDHDDG